MFRERQEYAPPAEMPLNTHVSSGHECFVLTADSGRLFIPPKVFLPQRTAVALHL